MEAAEANAGTMRSLRVIGPPRVEVNGKEVATGLRETARELLCLLALRPAGVRLEEGLAAMWPEDEDRRIDVFRVSVTATRRLLRELTRITGGQYIVYRGGRYSLDVALVDADVWQLERSLADAARASGDEARRQALGRVEPLLSGEPLAGVPYEWAEPEREALRRRAVDALAELARLHAQSGDTDEALVALERARGIDPACEDVYRRLMRQLADVGRADTALRVYSEVERRAAQLGDEPEDETDKLMVEIHARAQSYRRGPLGEGDLEWTTTRPSTLASGSQSAHANRPDIAVNTRSSEGPTEGIRPYLSLRRNT